MGRREGLCDYIGNQHSSLFQSQGVQRLDEIMNVLQRKVSPMMNDTLLAAYSEEITTTPNGIGVLKLLAQMGCRLSSSKNPEISLGHELRMRLFKC
jgi:hypothetical protein